MASRNLPFEFAERWPQLGQRMDLSSEVVELLDRRDRDLEDYLAGAERPVKTFHQKGAITVLASEEYAVPYAPRTRLWTGHITTFGTGPVVVTLNRRRAGVTSVVATLSITASGLAVVSAPLQWLYGDIMWAATTSAGTGNVGFVGEVI